MASSLSFGSSSRPPLIAAKNLKTSAAIAASALAMRLRTLRTGADGTIGVTLKDDTRLALGPGSEVRLERFAYAPGTGRARLCRLTERVLARPSGRRRQWRAGQRRTGRMQGDVAAVHHCIVAAAISAS